VRLLVYNIRYATGTGPAFHFPVPGAGYLRSSRRVLERITELIRGEDPDLVGLIEVDTGSVRTGMVNQATHVADALGHYTAHQCKYGTGSINQLVPIVRKQSNALLAAPRVTGERFHYFDTGIKRLIIELELDQLCVFLVHLSLKFRHRQYQLRTLHDLVVRSPKPVIVAGDFNTFWGTHEIFLFMRAAGLRSANTRGAAVVSVAPPAGGAGFHPGQPGHRRHLVPHPGRHLLRSSAAGVRFRAQRQLDRAGVPVSEAACIPRRRC
jgi:endonuclease/exonuclease/phosphatase family metal-dependent hydrolase